MACATVGEIAPCNPATSASKVSLAAEASTMAADPFYAPNHKAPAPAQPRPLEPLWWHLGRAARPSWTRLG